MDAALPEDASTRYRRFAELLEGESLPAAFADLDAIDRNIEILLEPVRAKKKRLRVASKSIRCPELLRYILDRGGDSIRGIMAYSAPEAALLAERGFDDILIAYPTVRRRDLEAIAGALAAGANVSLVADTKAHLDALAAVAKERGVVAPVVVEADVSYRPAGGALHFGVRRSPLRSAAAVVELAKEIARRPELRFHGVLAYEAQIAGVADASPFAPLLNGPKRALKALSRPKVLQMRHQIAEALLQAGLPYTIFNGGGSSSLAYSSADDALTEVSAGSGFVASHLFDYFRGLELSPGLFFALQVVRASDPRIVTCQGGAYVASGEAGVDRLPRPYLPSGLSLTKLEAAGEVQTPLMVPAGVELAIGDPVIFRHAKAGELAEHFNEYLLIRGRRIEGRAQTYRGLGRCFL